MHILEGSLAYLIGSIEASSDLGKGWRKEIIDLSKEQDLRIKFLNPTNKLCGLQNESEKEQEIISGFKRNKQWEELSVFIRKIIRIDHRSVDLCDCVIVYVDPKVHMCGSYFELQSALCQHKPYFIIVPSGKENTPSWLFGICDHNYIFGSVKEVVYRFKELDDGSVPLSDRWVLFRKQLQEI